MNNYYFKTITKTHKDPKEFSGVLYESDFDTERGKDNNNGSHIANRIAQSQKFDEWCRKGCLGKAGQWRNKKE